MYKLIRLLAILLLFFSCDSGTKMTKAIDAIDVSVSILRFDQEFGKASTQDLEGLKAKYPYLFAKQYEDAYWNRKLVDSLQRELTDEVSRVFPDMDLEQEELERLFKHIKYYYPETTVPKVITITSEVEYRNKVILVDSLLIVALDTYLGEDHHFYGGVAKYHSKNFRKEQLVVDVAAAFAKAQTLKPQAPTFLAQMIYEGKQLYFMEQLLPQKQLQELFGYTSEEYDFAVENERNVWQNFVASELLYNTDRSLLSRFIDPAPFSKFYLEFDSETPGRLGRFMGYKMIVSYMKNNDIPLKTMLIQPADVIFASAKYKP
ncbi:MAG: gliding motility-associated lipoprotein GldB [Flavobacteriales bacterium]|jgi:gliding motility-associated lipoprotein GldB